MLLTSKHDTAPEFYFSRKFTNAKLPVYSIPPVAALNRSNLKFWSQRKKLKINTRMINPTRKITHISNTAHL